MITFSDFCSACLLESSLGILLLFWALIFPLVFYVDSSFVCVLSVCEYTNASDCLDCTIICAIYLKTLAQRVSWKCWLLFDVHHWSTASFHISFVSIHKLRKNAHLMGSIKINYFVISEIIV